ncbi:MAG: hypothetical protein ACIAQF_11555, partial [Phycisphaerales bacterium JB065]
MRVLDRFRQWGVLIAIAMFATASPKGHADPYVVNTLAAELEAAVEIVYTANLPISPDGLDQSLVLSIIEGEALVLVDQGFSCAELYEAANLAVVESLDNYGDPETVSPVPPVVTPCALVGTVASDSYIASGVIASEHATGTIDGDPAEVSSENEDLTNDDGSHGLPPDDDCPHADCWIQNHLTGGCLVWVSLCPPPSDHQFISVEEVVLDEENDVSIWIIEADTCPETGDCDLSNSQVDLIEDLLGRLSGYGYGAEGDPCGQTQPEQYREGAGSRSENPVMVAEGVKTDRVSDLYIPLRGKDFELTRHYNAGDLVRSDRFPWMLGRGWGMSADGWLSVTEDEILGDMISITTYPLESSERYVGEPGQTDGVFDPMGPDTSVVRTDKILLALYDLDNDNLSYSGDAKLFSTFVYDKPGEGQIAFFRTEGASDPDHESLHGRIAQRRDAAGNIWSYRYVRYSDENGDPTDPRLLAIYLNHQIQDGGGMACDARVVFDWDIGDQQSPGTGMVRSIRAQRPVPSGVGSGIDWQTVQKVSYTYSNDTNLSMASDLVRSGITDPLLVMVERSELVNAPLTDDLTWPSAPVWHETYAAYRYLGVDARMSHEFNSREIEYFAEYGNIGNPGIGFTSVKGAAEAIITNELTDSINLLNTGATEIEDLASKIIEYYEMDPGDPDKDEPTDMATEAFGFPWGLLEGRVRLETLQSACGCGGGTGFDRQIEFIYARKDILDFQTEFQVTIPGLNNDPITVQAAI